MQHKMHDSALCTLQEALCSNTPEAMQAHNLGQLAALHQEQQSSDKRLEELRQQHEALQAGLQSQVCSWPVLLYSYYTANMHEKQTVKL